MGLQCKLPKSVHDGLVNMKNKTMERLSAAVSHEPGRIAPPSPHPIGGGASAGVVSPTTAKSSSSMSTKLFLFLLTFLGLLAFILWLTTPSSSPEEETNKEERQEKEEEETRIHEARLSSSSAQDEGRAMLVDAAAATADMPMMISQQRGATTSSTTRRRTGSGDRRSPPQSQQGSNGSSKYPIDTIYESLAEVYEEKRSLRTNEEVGDVSVQETKEMLIRQTREELVRTIQQQQQLKQQKKQPPPPPPPKEPSPTADMVDRILDDLIADDMETYAYSKHEKKGLGGSGMLAKQDSMNNKTETSNPSSGSQNSLLSLYNVRHVNAIEDRFRSLDEVSSAVKEAGLEKGQLIFGIDFTISNLENGARTFGGRSLHHYEEGLKNPYQKVIEIMGKTLEVFDLDGRIPAYGFGDAETKDRKVFSFSDKGYCLGFQDVLDRYNEILKKVTLSGPTNFAPLIKQAIKIVKETKQYHILVIVADGQVTNERQTRDAIVEASKHALSIVMVGVGDGPWDTMTEFDDSLPKRQFDNFQFVNYHEVCEQCPGNPDEAFALHALMEIPDQFKTIKELKFLDKLK